MSINSIRLSAYGFRMEAVGSKKFIKRERDAFLEFAAGRVNETAQKLAEAVCAEPLHPFCNCAMPGVDSDQEHEKSKDTGKELNITHKYKKTFTLDELRALIRNGEIQNHVSVGDTIWIMFDGKEVPYDVIGFDVEELADKTLDHSMTIQAHVAIEAREFDTKGDYGSNVWADSELREYLQSDEFKERFADLIPYLAKVKKNNSNGEQTEDLFSLLSKEEFDPEETPYEFYENKANRVKFTDIVLVHEFGHFIFAKMFGVYVYEFSIGMGPKIFGKKDKKGETEYCIRAIPIGGFVQLSGEEIDDDSSIPKDKKMYSKPVWQRFLIMFFGAGNNFILAFILLFIYALIWKAPIMTPTISSTVKAQTCTTIWRRQERTWKRTI